MTNRALTALAALVLMVNVGCNRKQPAATTEPAKLVPTLAHEVDFGTLPEGWALDRLPHSSVPMVVNASANAAIVVAGIVSKHEMPEQELISKLANLAQERGIQAPVQDQDGDWYIEGSTHERGQKTGAKNGEAFVMVRTFKNDLDTSYTFYYEGAWRSESDSALRTVARAIVKGAKIK